MSRGNLLEGVMKGNSMLDFIPIASRATDVQTNLVDWISSWLLPAEDKDKIELLEPKGWFTRGHDIAEYTYNCDGLKETVIVPGYFVWSPPPAVAEGVVEELRKSRHKRQQSTHVFVCQKLMKPWWLGQLHKVADIVLEIRPGVNYWSKFNHESLILAICFPFTHSKPWQLRNQPRLVEVGRVLRGVWKEGCGTEGIILRELCELSRSLVGISPSMVWEMLQSRSLTKVPHRQTNKRSWQCMEEEK